MQRKVDDSKTEWLDASSIDRSQKIISLDNHKRFKPTSDIIPHDKKVSILPLVEKSNRSWHIVILLGKQKDYRPASPYLGFGVLF
jgi:hypothetical protein